ncbi:ABC transporter ATP-binding protein [Candidatus Cytomitobacter indipagum]|uniref:ABC transporter ATP-binding protein n=1 Tax=Candidatus Cytomitobacter indipagum TaxID=2601575 RepID=A0A5C0UD07_9PROT|nr:ATP-binding cassette domain-containing protein [Candidatus Cytomitobacter indipagum]QEK37858.1 ABC transporter ATP-binding protein [Candidatus Cytomitobacter indipagum]
MIFPLYIRLIKIFLHNAMKFKLRFLLLILISAIYIASNGIFPLLLYSVFVDKSTISAFIIINKKLLTNAYPQLRNLLTYKAFNAIIIDAKSHAVKTYISSDGDKSVELGQIKRLSDHMHRIINSSFNFSIHLFSFALHGLIMYRSNILLYLIPAFISYSIFYVFAIIKWTPMIKKAYAADNATNSQSILAIKYKESFHQSSSLFQDEVTTKLQKEYNAYNKQVIYIRSFALIINISLYAFFSILIYFNVPAKMESIYIMHGAMMIGQITKLFGLSRHIIGLLHGINLDIKHKKNECKNIIFSNIQAQNISFNYDDRNIIKNLSFSIQPNECILIFGNNGSGKTTLCKLISGIFLYKSGIMKNGNFELNQENQNIWRSHIIYKEKDLIVFESELEQLKNNKKWIEFFPEKNYLLDQKQFSSGEHNFLSLSASILHKKIWALVMDESLNCIDIKTGNKLIQFLKMHIPSIIISSQHEIEHDKIIKLEKEIN